MPMSRNRKGCVLYALFILIAWLIGLVYLNSHPDLTNPPRNSGLQDH